MQSAIDIKTPDRVCDATVTYPDQGGPFPAVLVYMDAPGIRPALLELSQRLADQGYYVLLPNLYYREGRTPVFDYTTAFTEENRPKVFALIAKLTPDVVLRDAGAFLDFLSQQKQVRPGPIGITGYCMGGPMMLRAAAAFPDKIAAGASFHGAYMATDAPDSPHHQVARIRAKLYFGLAEEDPTFPPEQIERLTRALDEAAAIYEMETYPGTHHGFAIPGHAYHREGSERHWEKMLALFQEKLKPA